MFSKTEHSNKYKIFENKSITNRKKKGLKISEFKYGNTKLWNVWEHKQVSLV